MALRFPADLPYDYHLSILFKKYSRPDPFTYKVNLDQPAQYASDAVNVGGGIVLPIPANIVNSQDLNWESASSLVGSAVINGVGGAMEKDKDKMTAAAMAAGIGAGDVIGEVLAALVPGGSPTAAGAGAGMQPHLGGIAASALQNMGLALNPVLTKQFNHPEFKAHEFTWRLAPETEEESKTLQEIISTISFNALPDLTTGGLFFTYPSIAIIKINTGSRPLYNFQPCVITNITVNYAGAGAPAWFARTHEPVVVDIKVSFIEIVLNTRSNSNIDYNAPSTAYDFSTGGLGAQIGSSGLTKALKALKNG